MLVNIMVDKLVLIKACFEPLSYYFFPLQPTAQLSARAASPAQKSKPEPRVKKDSGHT